mmetsp:Transcript_19073/g.38887  ORF Transcript_19073/g.38887 Transcript_19073/m.38887 type:complete len:82 (+) Transcript_19073:318-563(+)
MCLHQIPLSAWHTHMVDGGGATAPLCECALAVSGSWPWPTIEQASTCPAMDWQLNDGSLTAQCGADKLSRPVLRRKRAPRY